MSASRRCRAPTLTLPRKRGREGEGAGSPRVALLLLLGIATGAATAEPPPGATSCSGCHPPIASAETKVPPLRGQKPAGIVAAMEAFRSGERPSTVMGRIAKGFSDGEIQAIATWVAEQR